MGHDRGFDYTVALTHAIQASTESVATANPEAFRYRGADLRAAVERALYINLASHAPLMSAFAERGEAPPLGSWMADATGAVVLDRAAPPARLDARALAARGLFAARAAADRRRARKAAAAPAAGGPACFVLDHPKYLRFIAPIRDRLRGPSAVVATDPGDAVDVHVEPWSGDGGLEARAVGRALWGFPSLMRGYDRVLTALSELGASRTVVVEGMSPLDEIASQASKALGIPSVCLQQGWSPLVHTGFRDMTQTKMAVWGEGFRDLLEPHNPGVEFAVTGHPALGAEQSTGRLVAELAGRQAVAFFLQSTSSWIAEEHLRALHELVAHTAASLPSVAVLVREHPGAPLGEAELSQLSAAPNVRLVPAQEWSLRDVLDAADVAVSIYSTSLLEGAALGTPAVIFNPTSLRPFEPDLVNAGAATRAVSPGEALEQIATVVSDPEHRARMLEGTVAFRDRYFAGGDASRAAERVAALIDESAT